MIKEDLEKLREKWLRYCDKLDENCSDDKHTTNDVVGVVYMCYNDLADVLNKCFPLQNDSSKQTKNGEMI